MKKPIVVNLTGAPGAGKSTVVFLESFRFGHKFSSVLFYGKEEPKKPHNKKIVVKVLSSAIDSFRRW